MITKLHPSYHLSSGEHCEFHLGLEEADPITRIIPGENLRGLAQRAVHGWQNVAAAGCSETAPSSYSERYHNGRCLYSLQTGARNGLSWRTIQPSFQFPHEDLNGCSQITGVTLWKRLTGCYWTDDGLRPHRFNSFGFPNHINKDRLQSLPSTLVLPISFLMYSYITLFLFIAVIIIVGKWNHLIFSLDFRILD